MSAAVREAPTRAERTALCEALRCAWIRRGDADLRAFEERRNQFLAWLPSAAEKHRRSVTAGGASRIEKRLERDIRRLRCAQDVLERYEYSPVYFESGPDLGNPGAADISANFHAKLAQIAQPLDENIRELKELLERMQREPGARGKRTSVHEWHYALRAQYTKVVGQAPATEDEQHFRKFLRTTRAIAGFRPRLREETFLKLLEPASKAT